VARETLQTVIEFGKIRRGFLLLLGEVGTGKSHLAAALMLDFKRPVFIKQSELLQKLRLTYRDRHAEDPIALCRQADLLVLDEVGVSAGGRDEFPLIHDILDYRYGELLPTCLTGNVGVRELTDMLGERMIDRL